MTGIRQAKRQARQLWLLGAVFALFILAIGFPVYLNYQRSSVEASQSRQQKTDLQCVTDWANATAARADRILALSNVKNAAQDVANGAFATLLLNIRHVSSGQFVALNDAYQKLAKASADYNAALKLHPLPPSPMLACGAASKPGS